MTRRRVGTFIAAAYLLVAVVIGVNFLMTPPDSFTNIFILIWTYPVSLALLWLLHKGLGIAVSFPFLPVTSLGYHGANMLYFVLATLLIAFALRRIIGGKAS